MTSRLRLSESDRAMLGGEAGGAPRIAMQIVTKLAEWMGAESLIDVELAHIDGCLFTGRAGLDFAEQLAAAGGRVVVPTTLNVSSLDLLHPTLYRGAAASAALARRQMEAYLAMGCQPTWTCAPYQLPMRPALGQQIAWGESNAIVFANSVLGARTERYGDFADIACALTGRAPAAGLHLDENRKADVIIDVRALPARRLADEAGCAVLGHWIGRTVGSAVPAIVGLHGATEDQLKMLGAAAASSGAVGMFHAVGITPEAPNLASVVSDSPSVETMVVTEEAFVEARRELQLGDCRQLGAVSLGTPHYSVEQIEHLVELFDGRRAAVPVYVSTGRDVLATLAGAVATLEASGVTMVTDTCTYITPIIADVVGCVLTDSAKWAYYAPGNIGVSVAFGSTAECVESAVAGKLQIGA